MRRWLASVLRRWLGWESPSLDAIRAGETVPGYVEQGMRDAAKRRVA